MLRRGPRDRNLTDPVRGWSPGHVNEMRPELYQKSFCRRVEEEKKEIKEYSFNVRTTPERTVEINSNTNT